MFSFDVKMCEGPKIGAQGVDKCATNVLNTSVNHNNDHQIQMFLVHSVWKYCKSLVFL